MRLMIDEGIKMIFIRLPFSNRIQTYHFMTSDHLGTFEQSSQSGVVTIKMLVAHQAFLSMGDDK
jgi:hypothetical protein